MLIYTSKIFIPSPKSNAIKDSAYGLPLSFYYKFYFDNKDSLTAKYLVVVYDDTTINYDFKLRPVKKLINIKLALAKIDKYEKNRKKLAAQQKREQEQQQKQSTKESKQSLTENSQSSSKGIFQYKSENYDIEKPGEAGFTTINDPSYHTVDFNNMTVTQTSLLNGQWVKISYPIRSYYTEVGALSTTFILVINSKGLKEVWFSPEVSNLGYDYLDGTRIACYDLSVIK
jgi:hypothetical protein